MRGIVILLVALLASAAALAESPESNGVPVVQSNGAVRLTAQGDFQSSVAKAKESAWRAAQDRLRDWLAQQSPPIHAVPSMETIRKQQMVVRESAPQEEQILNENLNEKFYRIKVEVELKPKQMRELRERDRVGASIISLGGLIAMLGLVVAFFRLDEWTKGYLTRWLIVGGLVMAAAALIALWWFAGQY